VVIKAGLIRRIVDEMSEKVVPAADSLAQDFFIGPWRDHDRWKNHPADKEVCCRTKNQRIAGGGWHRGWTA
jgi:hypothetical protein